MKTCSDCAFMLFRIYETEDNSKCCVDPPVVVYRGSFRPSAYVSIVGSSGEFSPSAYRPDVSYNDPACAQFAAADEPEMATRRQDIAELLEELART